MPAEYFRQFGPLAYVHHLALKTPALYREAVAAAARHPDATHVLEGDICWTRENGRLLFYFFHPHAGFDFPKAGRARRLRDEGKLLLLDDIEPFAANTRGVFELKLGDAEPGEAIPALLAILNDRFAGRFWIDSFSRCLLREVRRCDPTVPTSVHTEFTWKTGLLNTAPYRPVLGWSAFTELDEVDAVAIRCHLGERLTAVGGQAVRDAGKELILSQLCKPTDIAFARAEDAVAGYIHDSFETVTGHTAGPSTRP